MVSSGSVAFMSISCLKIEPAVFSHATGVTLWMAFDTDRNVPLRRNCTLSWAPSSDWVPLSVFVQESVGQHLFLMVSALTQQTAKGPVDCVTEKALYTLSEDWLLWQAQDFSSLVLTRTHTHTDARTHTNAFYISGHLPKWADWSKQKITLSLHKCNYKQTLDQYARSLFVSVEVII